MARVESFRLPVHIPSFPTIGKLISGKERYSTTCTVCGNSSGQLHEFHELDLSIEGHSSVTGALEGYMAEERLFGDNCYECSHCQKKQEAIRRTEIVETPDILFLQLLRYVYDRKTYEKKKSKVEISFPDELTLNGEEYKLVAVLYHKVSHCMFKIVIIEYDRRPT
jgi:ubiquitin carboxyl-terminal hydrolase 48